MAARILVVEDEAVVARDIERMLQKQGYQIASKVISGDKAVQTAAEDHPDLVLMDIKLNGSMDGIEAASQIRNLYNIPVIFLTAHSDDETLQRAKVSRPFGYVLKPIEPKELHTTVEMALYMHETEKKLQESEVQFRTILETALDGFWMIDMSGRFLDVNEAYCRMTGYCREELLTMSIADVEAFDIPAETCLRFHEICKTGWGRYETLHRTKAGHAIDVEISLNFIPQLQRGFAFLRDITNRKRAEQQIIKLNEDLQRRAQESTILYQLEKDQRELAETLVEASQTLISTLNVDIVLDRILKQIGRIVQNDVSNIMLIEGDRMKVVRSYGYEDFDAGTFIETYVFPLSGLPVRRQIIETGEPIVVPDVREDPRWTAPADAAWLRSYIAVPIILHKEVIGLINVGISMPNYYNTSHARRLQAFSYQAAIAFQNARLYEEMRKTAAQLETLSHRLLDVQETERRTIARELHDDVGQALTAAQIRLRAISLVDTSQAYQAELQECTSILDQALQRVRNLSLDLHPSLLDDLGLVPALRWFIDRESQWGNFSAQVLADSIEKRQPPWAELVCYRIVQEALTNVTRHAQAKQVKVELWQRGGELHLIIQDDGVGFDVQHAVDNAIKGSSLGLLGMQERVMLVKGKLEINSIPGLGTEIHARIPLELPGNPEELVSKDNEA